MSYGHEDSEPLYLILGWSQHVVFRALCFGFYFGMNAFQSTPLAFTSWLRSWRLVNCRVCNARGRMKGMQRLVMRSTKKGGAFMLTCSSFTSWPPEGILHFNAAKKNHPATTCWRDLLIFILYSEFTVISSENCHLIS